MIATLALGLLLQGAATVERAPTVSLRVTPETPAVGEPITVEIRVRAPNGTLVRFPVLPDTGTRIEPLDPRVLSGAGTAGEVDQTATYRLIAWDTGSVALAFGDVTLERDGRQTRYPVRATSLRIRSVLPRDSAARVPKAARAPVDAPTMPWRWLVAAVVVAALGYASWRKYRRMRAELATMDPGALIRARAAFAHLRVMDLAAAGESGRHLLAHVQVLRRYLGERWPQLSPALTAREVAARVEQIEFPLLPERLSAVLTRAEGVAYAGDHISAEVAAADAEAAVTIVEDLERAWVARQLREYESSKIKRKALR